MSLFSPADRGCNAVMDLILVSRDGLFLAISSARLWSSVSFDSHSGAPSRKLMGLDQVADRSEISRVCRTSQGTW